MAVDRPVVDLGSGSGVPAEVRQAARAAFAAVDPHAGLAELVSDSLDEDASDPADRRLAFRGSGFAVDVVVRDRALAVSVTPAPDGLGLETRGGAAPAPAATAPGRWTVSPAPTGPVSLVLTDGERRVRTAWARL